MRKNITPCSTLKIKSSSYCAFFLLLGQPCASPIVIVSSLSYAHEVNVAVGPGRPFSRNLFPIWFLLCVIERWRCCSVDPIFLFAAENPGSFQSTLDGDCQLQPLRGVKASSPKRVERNIVVEYDRDTRSAKSEGRFSKLEMCVDPRDARVHHILAAVLLAVHHVILEHVDVNARRRQPAHPERAGCRGG